MLCRPDFLPRRFLRGATLGLPCSRIKLWLLSLLFVAYELSLLEAGMHPGNLGRRDPEPRGRGPRPRHLVQVDAEVAIAASYVTLPAIRSNYTKYYIYI
jgi:hypothetical protein